MAAMTMMEDRTEFVRGEDAPLEEIEPGITRQVLGHDAALMMVRITFRKGCVGYVHSHPHRQASYIERGAFEVTMNGSKTVLKAGDCYFAPPGVPHGVVALEDGVLLDTFTPRRDDFLTTPE